MQPILADYHLEIARVAIVIAVVVTLGISIGLTIVVYRLSVEVAALNVRQEINFTTLRAENAVNSAKIKTMQEGRH